MHRPIIGALAALLLLPGVALGASSNAFVDPNDGAILDAGTHPRAIPTALGFGKIAAVRDPNAVIYIVNTGYDDPPDPSDFEVSLRECVEGRLITGNLGQMPITSVGLPRYCLIIHQGYIALQSPLVATHPKLFIAGAISAGDGAEVTLAGSGYPCTNALLEIATSDVVVTHLRFRGKPHPGTDVLCASNGSTNHDAIRINKGAERVFIDHISAAYTTDEVIDIYSGKDVTISNSIIGPPLCWGPTAQLSTVGHNEPWHCRPNFSLGAKNVTYAYNLVAYGEQRAFNFAAGQRDASENPLPNQWGQIDVINNVSYYFREEHGLVSNRFGHTFANFVNNTMWNGPQYDPAKAYPIGLYNKDPSTVGGSNTTGFAVYHNGNRTFRTTIASLQGQAGGVNFCGITPGSNPPTVDCTITGLGVVSTTTPAIAPENIGLNGTGLSLDALDISTAILAEKTVITFAGANRCQNTAIPAVNAGRGCRNEIDTAIVADYQTCHQSPRKFSTANITGGASPWPNSRANAFGNDSFVTTGIGTDFDKDGIPDWYEQAHAPGMNWQVFDANVDNDGDGYHNIEEYLADLAATKQWYNIHRTGFATPLAVPPNNCGVAINP